MRSTLLFLLQLLLLTSIIKQLPAVADTIRDTAGDELRSDVEYYILPVISGEGGVLTLSNLGNATKCPLVVVQEQVETSTGFPVTFSLADTNEVIIQESMDLNIKFSAVTTCTQSTVWQLKSDDESSSDQRFVTTGGVEGNPGRETLANWFRIETYDDNYKLNFCPSVCDSCRPQCQDIGILVDNNGYRRLAGLDDEAFKVKFQKV
ncbi:kunitz trypsin inhibitor 5-like [Telopea speciosissima]|uniref:kunitz trypsin inhibitor 5-like n=1 Tax=Telopea speciosissima TaxID=54955 RepID=UPI001CC6B0D9|nr:kunitz trypsin inhibitor 5-like [Telopea speciosissima]